MISRTASSARKEFSDTINRVIYLHERILLERHGKPVAVILPMDEYSRIQEYFKSGEELDGDNGTVDQPLRHVETGRARTVCLNGVRPVPVV